MADELLGGMLPEKNLRFVATLSTELSRKARDLQTASPASASVLAQALTSAVLMASLQKADSRLNLQIECDGPLRGLFVDADNQGNARGYVKNQHVGFTGQEGEFRWRPVLGNSGFLSVLRDIGEGEYYRSSVELERFDLALDLQRYYAVSEQLPTRVFLDVLPSDGEPIGRAGGLLVQLLPDGDVAELDALEARLRGGRFTELLGASDGVRPLLKEAFGDERYDVLSQVPVTHRCHCSRERVLNAIASMGRQEIEDMLQKDKKAEATCQFCATQYVISESEIRSLLS